jgi:VWA domain-containing protein
MIRRRFVLAATFTISCLLTGASAQRAPTIIRSGVDVVLVPVSVTAGNRPVLGLTSSDFELQDNGIAQEFSCAAAESLPVDATLVIDRSGSVRGKALEQFNTDVQRIAESLQPNDRVRLITFAADATDVSGLQPGGVAVPVDRISGGGATSLYNALAAALMSFPHSDRPQVVFGFSDGLDNMSFLDLSSLDSLAGHSPAVLYLTLVSRSESGSALSPTPMMLAVPKTPTRSGRFVPYIGGPNRRLLTEAAARTGGAVYQRAPGAPLSALFQQALDEFRSSYVLTFTPRGVKTEGWHSLVVRTKDPRHRVRSRSGYQGG